MNPQFFGHEVYRIETIFYFVDFSVLRDANRWRDRRWQVVRQHV